MKGGGQTLWNATSICETFKISCLMGRLHTRDVLGNHLKDRSFRLKGGAKKPELAKLLCENSGADVERLMDKFNLDLSLVARLDGLSDTSTWAMDGKQKVGDEG